MDIFDLFAPEHREQAINTLVIYLAEHDDLGLVHTALRYFYEVRGREERQAFWDQFKARLQPVLGEKFMVSIADKIRQEGMQQGMHLKEVEIAKKLLAKNLDIDFIAESTGIDLSLLAKFKEETKH